MNINKATTIIVILGVLASLINALIPYASPTEVLYLTIAASTVSESINAIKSGFEDKTEDTA